MSSEKQKELMKLFHELDIWKNLYFQGVEIIKNPLEWWYALHSRLPHILWLADPPTAHVLYHL